MWKSLQAFIKEMDETEFETLTPEERAAVRERLLTKIAFYQHERLIHLIVTSVFAILTLLTLVLILISDSIGFAVLELLFIILLIPYIIHYYHLENGVQKLYHHRGGVPERIANVLSDFGRQAPVAMHFQNDPANHFGMTPVWRRSKMSGAFALDRPERSVDVP